MPLAARDARSLLGESALALLGTARRTYTEALSSAQPIRGRVVSPRTPIGALGATDVLIHGFFLRSITVAEAFVDAVVQQRARGVLLPDSGQALALLQTYTENASRSWPNRNSAFKDLLGFALTESGSWARLRAATDVRNSIVHSLGALNTRQLRSQTLHNKVAKVGGSVRGQHIHLSEQSSLIVWTTCRSFIRDIDRAIVRQ
jgi:hypothetical protein